MGAMNDPTSRPAQGGGVVDDRARVGRKGAPRGWGSRLLTVLGVLMLTLGLGYLGYVGWEFFGTTYVSKRAADDQVVGLRQEWTAGDPVQTGGVPQTEAEPPATSTAWLIRIPALGPDYEWPIVSGISLSDLDHSVGWFPTSALPGQIGNFALAGHRVTHGEPFRDLLDLEVGDEVIIETQTAIYTYVITDPPSKLTVQDTESWVLDPVPGQPGKAPTEALITLTTCQDFFRSPDRSVGFGVLEKTELKTL